MRPTSVIFLIISILLACVGGMLCLSAMTMAEESGEVLFESVENEDGNFVTTKYFGLAEGENPDHSSSKNNIKKMEFNFENVDVVIKGGQDVNKIELYNFTEGVYSYKTSVGGALSIDDLTGLLKMVSFSSSGINFKGFRNLLFYFDYAKLERQVVVYLRDDTNVTNISCTVNNGSISVENLTKTCDIKLTASAGDVSVKNIAKDSSVTVSLGTGSVLVEDSSLYVLTVDADTAPVDIKNCPITRALEVSVDNGDVSYDHVAATFEGFDVIFKAIDGRLKLNDEIINSGKFAVDLTPEEEEAPETDENGEPIETETEEGETSGDSEFTPNSLKITVKVGNVFVTTGEPITVPDAPETGDVTTSSPETDAAPETAA